MGLKFNPTTSQLDLVGSGSTYTLPIASASVLGGIKVGSGLSIDSGTGILTATTGGSGDVLGPVTNTDSYIPQWNGANSKTLKDGLAVPAGGLAGLTALGTKLDSSAFSDTGVTSKLITGFSSGAGTVAATDTILQAINKLDGNLGTKGSGTVTSVAAITLGTTGTDLSSTVATGTTTPVITLQVPTASASNRGALSSTDWSTFNGKQSALTFGIADTNKVQINAVDVADNDYARFTATGLEGRSYSEVLSDIGAQASLGFTAENVSNKATTFGTINDTLYPSVKAVNDAITTAVTGLLDYRGSYDASTNLYPATGGSGIAGVVAKGDFWIVSVGGTLGSKTIHIGDYIIALTDVPAQTDANWDTIDTSVGYVPENSANKENTTIDTSTTKYPTVNLLKTGLDLKAPLAAPTFSTSITGSYLTASQILATNGSKNIVSLDVATYPSLTELSYVKDVTSSIQTQLNAKGAGTVTAVSVATANGVSGSSSGGATPALTIALGSITPSSVNSVVFSGSSTPTLAITGTSSISGSNTGDQTGGTPAIVLGTANTAGSSTNFLRRDDTILVFDTTVPSTQAFGDAAAVGTATVVARRDHKHAMMAAPTTVSGNAGTATKLAATKNINGVAFDGSADITVPSIVWTEVTGTSQSMAVNSGYILNNGSLVTATLPSSATLGSMIEIAGKGAGGWKVAQNASQIIHFGNVVTTTGTGGYLASTDSSDCIRLLCIIANTTWVVLSSIGNLTFV